MNPVSSTFSLKNCSRPLWRTSRGVKIFQNFTVEAEKSLKRGGVGVIPTDTIYGIVGSALSKRAVARIYKLRRRASNKPFIVLIGSISVLRRFDVKVGRKESAALKKFWPGKVSVILEMANGKEEIAKFNYLHRGAKTLAFRLPADLKLKKLLRNVGPLVAPSANIEGKPPAKTIGEAQKYFGGRIDFYVDSGKLISQPSTLISFDNGKVSILRQGAGRIRKRT